MLTNVHIERFAIVDYADIDFEKGLSVITGETGSGKSVILKAIDVCMGAKTSTDVIRTGEDNAIISLSFYVDDINVINELKQFDIPDLDEGQIIIQRKILPQRSQFKLNGVNVTAGQVRTIASYLYDMHGQRDTLSILNDANQAIIVDKFADDSFNLVLMKQKHTFKEYKEILSDLDSVSDDEQLRQREISLLEFEINEIEEADLSEEECEEIENEYKKMQNMENIMQSLSVSLNVLNKSEVNALDLINEASKEVNKAAGYDEELVKVSEIINNASEFIYEAKDSIESYISDNEFDYEKFEYLSERVNTYNHLKQKYGTSVSMILDLLQDKKEKLNKLVNSDAYIASLKEKLIVILSEMKDNCRFLREQRCSIANRLESLISDEMKGLNFKDVRFKISVESDEEAFTERGYDKIKFFIGLNPGEELKEMSSVASGGEMSRIMLAIKTVIADKDIIGTLIFDEIDTGISSKTAQCVAERLVRLSKSHQIICITHLPQIASMADNNYYVSKKVEDNKTKSEISLLDYDGQVNELARFLGGSKITDSVMSNAVEMKKMADQYKESL